MANPLERPYILDDALEAIGRTPLVRLDHLASQHGLKCNLLGKTEFVSAGGSIKDRIAKRMVEEAEKDGRLTPGKSVIIEPTSGNTGIALALIGSLRGYQVIIVMPEKMSAEKELTLRALGAHVVRTPTEAASSSENSNLGIAQRLQRLIPNGVILNQYDNPNNPLAHELGTGPEIIHAIANTPASDGRPSTMKVDAIVVGAGTGGTLTGLSKAIKSHNPQAIVVGVDPVGSILSGLPTDEPGTYLVEGIGYDFIPKVLSREFVDAWEKTTDEESFGTMADIIRHQGLLVGGSSGANVAGALRYLKSPEGYRNVGGVPGANAVVILPDGIRNYMSKPWLADSLKTTPTDFTRSILEQLEGTQARLC